MFYYCPTGKFFVQHVQIVHVCIIICSEAEFLETCCHNLLWNSRQNFFWASTCIMPASFVKFLWSATLWNSYEICNETRQLTGKLFCRVCGMTVNYCWPSPPASVLAKPKVALGKCFFFFTLMSMEGTHAVGV